MFFETAFGICIGCQIYNLLNKEKAQLCPGGVCEIPPDQIPKISMAQTLILIVFAAAMFAVAQWVYNTAPAPVSELPPSAASQPAVAVDPAEAERCKVPDFAKAMGHEEKWRLHNNCK
jgi:hypothetical protein